MGLSSVHAQISLNFKTSDPYVTKIRNSISNHSNSHAHVPKQKRINLVIVGPDPALESESSVGVQIDRIKKTVQGPVYYRRVNTADEFWQALRLNDDEYIQSLFILAIHGSNGGIGSQPVLSLYRGTSTQNDEFIFWDEFSTKAKLKFMPDALVVFGSCSIIPGPNELPTARHYLSQFSKYLGMTSGWMFAAYTSVTNNIDYFFKTPALEFGWRDTQGILAHQVLAPLTFLKFYYDDNFKYNRGYAYGFSGYQEVILKTHFYNARQGIISGNRIYP